MSRLNMGLLPWTRTDSIHRSKTGGLYKILVLGGGRRDRQAVKFYGRIFGVSRRKAYAGFAIDMRKPYNEALGGRAGCQRRDDCNRRRIVRCAPLRLHQSGSPRRPMASGPKRCSSSPYRRLYPVERHCPCVPRRRLPPCDMHRRRSHGPPARPPLRLKPFEPGRPHSNVRRRRRRPSA